MLHVNVDGAPDAIVEDAAEFVREGLGLARVAALTSEKPPWLLGNMVAF